MTTEPHESKKNKTSGPKQEGGPHPIFPYIRSIFTGLTAFAIMLFLEKQFPPSETSDKMRYDWTFYLAEGATIDAFSFVLFSPIETMRAWHNQIALFSVLYALPILWWKIDLSDTIYYSLSAFGSISLIASLIGVYLRYQQNFPQELKQSFVHLKESAQAGLFPDTSTWREAARHFIIVFIVNLTLWSLLSKGPFDFLILILGVLFEVSLTRYCFGQRTAKTDFVNVFAACIPFMEAVCGGLCSRFDLSHEDSPSRTSAVLFGFFMSECIGYVALYTFAREKPGAHPSKFLGTVLKTLVLMIFGAPQAIPLCRALVVGGNLYVLVLDIFTINWKQTDAEKTKERESKKTKNDKTQAQD